MYDPRGRVETYTGQEEPFNRAPREEEAWALRILNMSRDDKIEIKNELRKFIIRFIQDILRAHR